MAMISFKQSINEINNEKVYATKVSSTSADAPTDLSTIQNPITISGAKVCATSGISQPLLCLQGTQDFWYCFNTATGTAVTTAAGSNPGTLVKAGVQEYVRPAAQTGRTWLHVLRDSADGVVVVSVCKFAGN